jgi:hypothetical protein
LHILPAESEDEAIKFTLEVVSLETKELPFMALSYVWGDASVVQDVIVREESFQCRQICMLP